MTVNKSCRVCHRVCKSSICDKDKRVIESVRLPRQHRGYNSEYERNRRIIIDESWMHHKPCCLCGLQFNDKSDITAEHIIPLREGGNSSLCNLAPAHAHCNYGWRNSHPTRD